MSVSTLSFITPEGVKAAKARIKEVDESAADVMSGPQLSANAKAVLENRAFFVSAELTRALRSLELAAGELEVMERAGVFSPSLIRGIAGHSLDPSLQYSETSLQSLLRLIGLAQTICGLLEGRSSSAGTEDPASASQEKKEGPSHDP